jgi:hypothetical protein
MKSGFLFRLCNRCTFIISFLLMASLFASSSLCAHTVGESYIYLRVYDNRLTGIFHITLRDLNDALGLQTPDVQITEENLVERKSEIHNYYREKVQFFDKETELPIRFTDFDILQAGSIWVLTQFVIIENAATPEVIGIDYNVLFEKNPDHVALLAIEHFWKASIFNNEGQESLIFSAENHRQQLSFSGYSAFTGFMGVVMLGIKHFWGGFDHLLFIIALLLPAVMDRKHNSWQPVTGFRPALMYVVKIITLLTIAHSVALSIAAVGHFTLPLRLVDSVVALSIAIAALDIVFPIYKRKFAWVVFVFGLFHGFGFANVLAHNAVLNEHMALSLFGFNLGLVIGQVVLICVLMPHLYLVRNSAVYPTVLMRSGAVVLIVVGMIWTADRAFLDIHLLNRVKGYVINMLK